MYIFVFDCMIFAFQKIGDIVSFTTSAHEQETFVVDTVVINCS